MLGFSMPCASGRMSLSAAAVSSDVTATGPTDSSLLLPNMAYTNTGINAPASRVGMFTSLEGMDGCRLFESEFAVA